MTSTLRNQARSVLGIAAAALMLLSAGPALASEVTGTLSSTPPPGSTITGTVTGGGSTATGTITGGTGSTITGTVSDPAGGGGGRSGGSSRNNNNGEVLGAETGPSDGVGGGFGFPDDTPGAPNAGVGPGSLLLIVLLGIASAGAAASTYATRRYAR